MADSTMKINIVAVDKASKTLGGVGGSLNKLSGVAAGVPMSEVEAAAAAKGQEAAQKATERESERNGGGWDFEVTLPAAAVPPPFKVKAINQLPAGQAPAPARVSVAAKPSRPVAVALPTPPQPMKPIRPNQPSSGSVQPALGRPAAGLAPQPPQPPPQAAAPPPAEEEETGRVRRTRVRPNVPRPPQ